MGTSEALCLGSLPLDCLPLLCLWACGPGEPKDPADLPPVPVQVATAWTQVCVLDSLGEVKCYGQAYCAAPPRKDPLWISPQRMITPAP
jgi:hypothetical protein